MLLIQTLLASLLTASAANAALLLDFNAARGDDINAAPFNKLGQVNLQIDRSGSAKPSKDLFLKKGSDWKGVPAAHAHRKEGYIRAEYHGLDGRTAAGKTEAGKTFWVGYQFALGEINDSLMIWQWKEYGGNGDKGGANIPLSLEIKDKKLMFQHQDSGKDYRHDLTHFPITDHQVYRFAVEIVAKADGGSARVWWEGKPASLNGTTTLKGNMYPANGHADPKFGIYEGNQTAVDSWTYLFQVGETQGDLDSMFFSA